MQIMHEEIPYSRDDFIGVYEHEELKDVKKRIKFLEEENKSLRQLIKMKNDIEELEKNKPLIARLLTT